MSTEKLEAALRALGWAPIAADRSVTTRAWKRVDDSRPLPTVIRVPRTHWVDAATARDILYRASSIGLR